jgi:cytochrome oxidase Cu insertion factor (SCO1/SenC/PrrC family)
MERKRVAEATKGIGRPKVGGAFELVDTEGRHFTHENLKGRYALVSSLLEYYTQGVQILGLDICGGL